MHPDPKRESTPAINPKRNILFANNNLSYIQLG
jgi:hypothetical protein